MLLTRPRHRTAAYSLCVHLLFRTRTRAALAALAGPDLECTMYCPISSMWPTPPLIACPSRTHRSKRNCRIRKSSPPTMLMLLPSGAKTSRRIVCICPYRCGDQKTLPPILTSCEADRRWRGVRRLNHGETTIVRRKCRSVILSYALTLPFTHVRTALSPGRHRHRHEAVTSQRDPAVPGCS